jgi:hypothetical protein
MRNQTSKKNKGLTLKRMPKYSKKVKQNPKRKKSQKQKKKRLTFSTIHFFLKNPFEKDVDLKRKRKSKAAHSMAINKISKTKRATLIMKISMKMKNTRFSNISMKSTKKIQTTFLKINDKS